MNGDSPLTDNNSSPDSTETKSNGDNQDTKLQSDTEKLINENFKRNNINKKANNTNLNSENNISEDVKNNKSIKNEIDKKVNSIVKKENDKKKKNKKRAGKFWPLKAFFITLVLSGAFSLINESVTLNVKSIVFIYILVITLIFINITFDIIGLAFASCDITPFYSQASKKVKGSKLVLKLLKNADVVSNICNDVIGDICGIVSGAAGMALTARIAVSAQNSTLLFISILVSSLIAAFTVSGKAAAKKYAINNSQKIVERIGKILSVFSS